jgi:hypothetical protein
MPSRSVAARHAARQQKKSNPINSSNSISRHRVSEAELDMGLWDNATLSGLLVATFSRKSGLTWDCQ